MGVKDSQSDQATVPRSLRHKRVLDLAAEQPDASTEEIAGEIPSATAEYVENILEEYGDPAAAGTATAEETDEESANANGSTAAASTTDADDSSNTGAAEEDAGEEAAAEDDSDPEAETGANESDSDTSDGPSPDLSDLSDKQVETLRAIQKHPEYTQSELGEVLGVSSATVCNRVNSIAGLEWEKRGAYVEHMDNNGTAPTEETATMGSASTETEQTLEEVTERLSALEQRVDQMSTDDGSCGLRDPALAHKVLHACLASDVITEEEELDIIRELVE